MRPHAAADRDRERAAAMHDRDRERGLDAVLQHASIVVPRSLCCGDARGGAGEGARADRGVAAALAGPGERVTAVLRRSPSPASARTSARSEAADGARTWVVLDDGGAASTERLRVRDTVTILALCELAEETRRGGELEELRSQLAALRLTENPPGIDEAEEAALELQRVLGAPPSLATPARLDAIGAATRKLELALGGAVQGSPFAAALKSASEVVAALLRDVEGAYRRDLTLVSVMEGSFGFPIRRRSRGSPARDPGVRRASRPSRCRRRSASSSRR